MDRFIEEAAGRLSVSPTENRSRFIDRLVREREAPHRMA